MMLPAWLPVCLPRLEAWLQQAQQANCSAKVATAATPLPAE
jgi:hypothetical protein